MKLCESWVKKAEIDYTFPNEHVLAASHDLIPWFTDLNYLAIDMVRSYLSFHPTKRSCMMWKFSFGMSRINIGIVLMVLFVVVCPKFRCLMFLWHATPHLWVGIIVLAGLPITFCNVATICQPSTKMLMSSRRHVIGANEIEVFLKGKSFLWIPFL